MKNVEVLLEHYRKQLGITEEQEQQLIEEYRAGNPVSILEQKLVPEINNLDQRTQGMQEIDFFTLDQTNRIDERTEGMQDIDQFTLDFVFELLARVEQLEQKVAQLEGGNA
jgi:hypothetical protein